MSFSSLHFLVFFPLAVGIYYLLPRRFGWACLLLASLVFYAASTPGYLLLMLAMICVDFRLAVAMSDRQSGEARRKACLGMSLLMNLGLLVFFKYYNFFISNVNYLAGWASPLPLLHLIVPLGLSFYIFQAMSYTLDVYRGDQAADRHLGRYALYMMFFPIKALGPIERGGQLLPQLRREHTFDYDKVVDGLKQMAWGYFKKTVVADRLVLGVDTVYGDPSHFVGTQLILATVLYTFQIYADFSGYADIAVGAGKVLGFDLVNNFRRPYFAAGLPEFWRRWHISLYSWFNDYLFTPLSVAQRDWGKIGVVSAIMLTFTLSGLWHGAAWTYVIWGGLHGLGLSCGVLMRRRRGKRAGAENQLARSAAVFLTFSFVTFAFIFFRARNVRDAVYIVTHLGSGLGKFVRHSLEPAVLSQTVASLGYYKEQFYIAVIAIAAMMGIEWAHSRFDLRRVLQSAPAAVRWSSYYAIVLVIAMFGAYNATQPFIYVQF